MKHISGPICALTFLVCCQAVICHKLSAYYDIEETIPTCPPPTGEPQNSTFYPNPANCSNFIQCDNGAQHVIDCPPGLYYCSELQMCDWEWSEQCAFSDCQILKEVPECPPPSGSGNDTLYPNAENCSSFYKCANGVPHLIECPADLLFCSELGVCAYEDSEGCSYRDCQIVKEIETIIKAEELPDCPPPSEDPEAPVPVFPNPANCSNFYECDHGKAVLYDCPPGLYFCTEVSTCAWDYSPECSFSDCQIVKEIQDIKVKDVPECPPPSGLGNVTLYPNAENCSNFYKCANGEPYLIECPADLLFCSELGVCAYEDSEGCSYSDCQIVKEIETIIKAEELPDCPPPSEDPEAPVPVFPNPANCSNFYECDHGKPVLYDCPPGLYFCTEVSTCAWDYSPECSFSDCQIVKEVQHIAVKEVPECPPPSGSGNDTLYPNAENCSNFYKCANGVPYLIECPADLLFCSELGVCAYEDSEGCSYSDCQIVKEIETIIKAEELPDCPPPSEDPEAPVPVFPNPANCSNFYECDNGKPVLYDCPPGLYFCTEVSTCAWDYSPECSFSDCEMFQNKLM